MPYRASNGILAAEISDEEAREHYAAAEAVTGHYGSRFVTAIIGENAYGRRIAVAHTVYEPLDHVPVADGAD